MSQFVLFSNLPLSELGAFSLPGKEGECAADYVLSIKSYIRQEPLAEKRQKSQEDYLYLRRWRLKQHMICISGKDTSLESEAFVSGLPLSLEWEGLAEGPLAEAEFAEKWIRERPQSKTIPFVHLIAAHRYMAAFEISCLVRDEKKMNIYGKIYRQHLNSALLSMDEKIRCIARNMEDLPHVYLKCDKSP